MLPITFASCSICVLYTRGACSLETLFFWDTIHTNHLLIMDPAVLTLKLQVKAPAWTEMRAPSCFAATLICDPRSRSSYKAVAVFPYHWKLRLVSYFTAIYLVLGTLWLVQWGSTSSHFTWHLIGETSPHHSTKKTKFPIGIKWLSLLLSRRTNQHRSNETPVPAALANTSDAERPTPASMPLSLSPIPNPCTSLQSIHC